MKRIINHFLLEWKNEVYSRKPLILRGARQVGKTHAVRELGKTFSDFVEINFEFHEDLRNIFIKDHDPKRIIFQLSEYLKKDIVPGKTLLFIDEIQVVPSAIITLRYFYEIMPEQHIIAAGSLLDFAIEKVGMPVGRITNLFMYPMSFLEFLAALGHGRWVQAILEHDSHSALFEQLHSMLLSVIGEYLAIGGMPAAVNAWVQTKKSRQVKTVHLDLLVSYRQDFNTYAEKHQIKYVDMLFHHALLQLSKKFMYSRVEGYQKRELEPALELLQMAGIVNAVIRSDGQGIPLGAGAHLNAFKVIFLDVGLSQALLDLDITPWFIEPLQAFVNKGELVEAFVGQEILAYGDPIAKNRLFYWHREARNSQAEVDYLIQIKEKVIPIEVKSGEGTTLKSMHIFLESHSSSPYGIKFSTQNFSRYEKIDSYPLYAIAKIFFAAHEDMQKAFMSLVD